MIYSCECIELCGRGLYTSSGAFSDKTISQRWSSAPEISVGTLHVPASFSLYSAILVFSEGILIYHIVVVGGLSRSVVGALD